MDLTTHKEHNKYSLFSFIIRLFSYELLVLFDPSDGKKVPCLHKFTVKHVYSFIVMAVHKMQGHENEFLFL